MPIYKPDFLFTPFRRKKNLKIAIFGQNDGKTNWKAILNGENPLHSSLNQFLSEHGLKQTEFLFPSTGYFNAVFCRPEDLKDEIRLGGLTIRKNFPAEGLEIPDKKIMALTPADCYTVITLTASDKVFAFHAGAKSTFDSIKKESGKPSRKFESVVDACAAEIKKAGDPIEKTDVFIVCGISPAYYYLDIPEKVRSQFSAYGIPDANIIFEDSAETFATKNENGREIFWSHRRAMETGTFDGRNLVLIINS